MNGILFLILVEAAMLAIAVVLVIIIRPSSMIFLGYWFLAVLASLIIILAVLPKPLSAEDVTDAVELDIVGFDGEKVVYHSEDGHLETAKSVHYVDGEGITVLKGRVWSGKIYMDGTYAFVGTEAEADSGQACGIHEISQ